MLLLLRRSCQRFLAGQPDMEDLPLCSSTAPHGVVLHRDETPDAWHRSNLLDTGDLVKRCLCTGPFQLLSHSLHRSIEVDETSGLTVSNHRGQVMSWSGCTIFGSPASTGSPLIPKMRNRVRGLSLFASSPW